MSIIDLIKGQIGPSLVSDAASQLGESESNVNRAIEAFLPAVLGGVADNAQKPGFFDQLTGLAGSGLLSNLSGLLGGTSNPLITGLLSTIFGDKIGSLVSTISNFSGVKESSASSLLNLVSGAAFGSLGKYAVDHNLDASGFANKIEGEKSIWSSLLPAGLSLGSLGLGSLFGNAKETVVDATHKVADTTERVVDNVGDATYKAAEEVKEAASGGGGIMKWLLPLLLAAVVGWFLMRQCKKEPAPAPATTTDSVGVKVDSAVAKVENAADKAVAAVKEALDVKLPSGLTLKAYKGGIEDQIVNFLGSDDYKNGTEETLKSRWFNFDNLNFEFGTTTLTKESQVQLDNLKAILKEFPDAKVKIGAYTDKVGDDKANKALSQKRADAVKAALGSAQVVGAEGYGEEFATVDEKASDKEREADRKTAIRFVK